MNENLTILPVALSALLLYMRASLARKDREPLGDRDGSFLKNAASGQLLLIALGKMAAKQAAGRDVQMFGERIVDCHTVVYRELSQLGRIKGTQIPGDMDEKRREAVRRFSRLRGAGFDREFMNFMEEALEKEVSAFVEAARQGADPEVRAFARSSIPVLAGSLKLAKKTLSGVPGPTLQ